VGSGDDEGVGVGVGAGCTIADGYSGGFRSRFRGALRSHSVRCRFGKKDRCLSRERRGHALRGSGHIGGSGGHGVPARA
jgi:hypothetical protein